MSISMVGMDDILKAMKNIDANLAKKVLRKSLRKVLKPMVSEIKTAAPVGEAELTEGDKPHGQIKKFTKVAAGKRQKNRLSMVIKVDNKNRQTNPYWSAFTEKGTVNQPGQNWMKEVFDKDADRARNQLLADVKQGVEDLAKRG